MKIAYYPGCSLHSTGIEYDISTRKICQALQIELVEIKDWICCGSSPAHQSDELMAAALAAKNLVLAAQTDNLKEICAPCPACYSRLKFAQHGLTDPQLKKDVEEVVAAKIPEDIEVLTLLDVIIEKVGTDAVKQKVVKNLNGLKVVCYYGCLMTRPPKITGKDLFENPTDMETLMEALGAEPLDWNMKTFCCGASFALTQTHVALELIKKILTDAESVGADVIAVCCPLCHANLDGRQQQINEKFNTDFKFPILYFTELMGLAMGIKPKDLGLFKHLTEVDDFLKERALI
jgi:heterodisulfide reductase subunit B